MTCGTSERMLERLWILTPPLPSPGRQGVAWGTWGENKDPQPQAQDCLCPDLACCLFLFYNFFCTEDNRNNGSNYNDTSHKTSKNDGNCNNESNSNKTKIASGVLYGKAE